MATYRIITPLRVSAAQDHPPGAIVELSDTDVAPLLLCGAIEATDDQDDPGDPGDSGDAGDLIADETPEAKAAREEQERVDAEYERQLSEYNAKEATKATAKADPNPDTKTDTKDEDK